MLTLLFPTLIAVPSGRTQTTAVIPTFCDMAPPLMITSKGISIPTWEASAFAADKQTLECNMPLMSIQWCGLVLEQIDHDTLPMYKTPNSTPLAQNSTGFNFKLDKWNGTPSHIAEPLTPHNPAELKFPHSNFSMQENSPNALLPNFCAIVARSLVEAIRSPALLLDVHALLAMLLEVLMSVQMLALAPVCVTLVYVALMLLGAGVLLVIIDVAKAVIGYAILVAGLDPTRQSHASHRTIFMICMHILRMVINLMRMLARALASRAILMLILTLWLLTHIPMTEAVPRPETPKVSALEYFLPGVTRWDAIPYHDFRRVWWVALCAALGNINQEGWSLLQTARDQDIGAPGNPGTPAQTVQSTNRNQRVFGAILNYIEATSHLYSVVSATFANDGRGLFQYLWVYGHLPYTDEERTELENEWRDATISSAGIKYEIEAVFKWAEYISILADKLGKTENDKRTKYLAGFPSSFNVLVVAERANGMPGSYVHPANYPAHHPLAPAAHPNAGEPDIYAMARAFYGEWSRMVRSGEIKPIPKGFAGGRDAFRANDEPNSDEEEHACLARDRTSERTVCWTCGGLGHGSEVDGVGTCLTKKLGHRISKETLARMKYPEGYSNPALNRKPNSNSNRKGSFYSGSRSRARYSNYEPNEPDYDSIHARMIEPPSSDEDEESARKTIELSLEEAEALFRMRGFE